MDFELTDFIKEDEVRMPKQYSWKPKQDITVYELALCFPLLSWRGWFDAEFAISELPENCQRHFEEVVEK